MVVKLDPEHLGSVSIRLRMTGNRVDISIAVSDARTLDVLNRDRHVLAAAVSSARVGGDAAMTLSGSATEAVPAAAGTASGRGADAGTGGASDGGASASRGSSDDRRRGTRDGRSSLDDGSSGEGDTDDAAASAPAGGLYV